MRIGDRATGTGEGGGAAAVGRGLSTACCAHRLVRITARTAGLLLAAAYHDLLVASAWREGEEAVGDRGDGLEDVGHGRWLRGA